MVRETLSAKRQLGLRIRAPSDILQGLLSIRRSKYIQAQPHHDVEGQDVHC